MSQQVFLVTGATGAIGKAIKKNHKLDTRKGKENPKHKENKAGNESY